MKSSQSSDPVNSSTLTTGPEGPKRDTGEDWGAPVRVTALLIRACTGTRFHHTAIEYSIECLCELIERANNYKFKVVICDASDVDDFEEDEEVSFDNDLPGDG